MGGRSLTLTQAGRPAFLADFNRDGLSDIVWQNRRTGALSVWRMNGLQLANAVPLGPGAVNDAEWKMAGTPDMNGDGHPDILWQHDQGRVAVWFMNGEALTGGAIISDVAIDARWRIVASGDMDRDGSPDILWQHEDGTMSVWYMNGARGRSGEVIGQLSDRQWRIVGAADFNADGRLDFVWRHATRGDVAVWFMDDRRLLDGVLVNFSVPDPDWKIVGVTDFDTNGRPDLLWRNLRTGALAGWLMEGARMIDGVSLSPSSVPDTDWVIGGPR